MSATTPITQRDVARACGVHPSTICLALKNSPSIPLETRQRIQAIADELGYHPNVAARNLALLRNEKKTTGSLPLAWINQESQRDHWRNDADARAYFEGARAQAEGAGFHLEEIWARQPGMTMSRVIQIVRARGIEGVIFPVHREFDSALLSPAWTEFVLVGLNDLRLAEWTDTFAPDTYQNVAMAFQHLRATGHRRIGFISTREDQLATNGMGQSAFLLRQHELPPSQRVEPCLLPSDDAVVPTALARWLSDEAPDAVICSDEQVCALAELQDFQGCAVSASGYSGSGPSIDLGASAVGSAAVECLIGKMRRFERGYRASGRLHLLKGCWRDAPHSSVAVETAEAVVA